MNQWQIAAVRTSEANSRIVRNGQIECELGKISSAYNEREFCVRLIGSVEVATAYRKDIDEWAEQQKKVSSVITNDRHSKVTPEELARKWNVGLQTAKDTLQVTTQCGIRTAPDDKKSSRRSSEFAQDKVARHMVCRYAASEGQIEAWEYVRKRLYTREVHQGCSDDQSGGCQ